MEMRINKQKIILAIFDVLLINISLFGALFMRFDGNIPEQYFDNLLWSFAAYTVADMLIFYLAGLYKSIWKYASIEELIQIALATFLATLISILISLVAGKKMPLSVFIISYLLLFILCGAFRFSYRIIKKLKYDFRGNNNAVRRLMIVGAGQAGSMLIKELKKSHQNTYKPVVAIDDDPAKINSSLNGVPIKGNRDKICELAERYEIDEIVIAIPSASRKQLAEIIRICKKTGCKLKTLPGVYEIIDGKVSVKDIRDVNFEDLLGRDEIKLDTSSIAKYIENEVILVTGGGGSIGSELCRQIAKYNPNKLIIFDIYENSAFELQNELKHLHRDKLDLEVLIGSIQDEDRMNYIFEKYRPGVVFHAAAHKHVPLMEDSPKEAFKNNAIGTLNTAKCADKYGTKRFVLISTDKAVNPTNIMGATKRLAEMVIQSLNKISKTEFVAVRFGNVLGSNGSVVPVFKKQIAAGGPVTVTHPEVTRFFMTIPEAVSLVIQAGAMAKGGEIFILDMGEPVKIADLARDMIRLSGFEPDEDIKIVYTGLRPGEKLHEELLMDEEGITATEHGSIFVGRPLELTFEEVMMMVKKLENSECEPTEFKKAMAEVLDTYSFSSEYDKENMLKNA